MSSRENFFRAVRFEKPEHIPMSFWINASCFSHYPPAALDDLCESHPYLFPGFQRGQTAQAKARDHAPETHVDEWGVTMASPEPGIAPVSVQHPLADWAALDHYTPPPRPALSPDERNDPLLGSKRRQQAIESGAVAHGGLPHGHTFLRLCDIRGYEALLCDMADAEPRLWKLIEMVEAHNAATLHCDIRRGAECLAYPEDLGMQIGPMISPEHFRTYIKPSYVRLMRLAREAGCIIHMHSDGDIRDLADDLVDSGVEILNLQDLVNGLDWIRTRFKGKTCIDLDIDRQKVTRFGTPAEVDTLVRTEIETLGSREGGLIMTFGLYPETPLPNVKALMDAMEKYSTFFA